MTSAFFVASTGQHVGKTTACLGLVSGLRKRYGRVGFMKPVGQEHVEDAGRYVDKDVVLFKEYFQLSASTAAMSPVLVSRGFTRDFLDGHIDHEGLVRSIERSFTEIAKDHVVTVVEGTGHCGVGSILNLNNAQVAARLNLPMIIVASGGLGSSFDALALNHALCEREGVQIAGVLLNCILPEKRDMIVEYMGKAVAQLHLPILGCIPFDPFLSYPSMKDFEGLFQTFLVSGEEHRMRHFKHIRLVATSLENYHESFAHHQLIITPANREDIILATLTRHWDHKVAHLDTDIGAGMILTGDSPPRSSILDGLQEARIPMLYVPAHSYEVMQKITSFTAKIPKEDTEKIREAVALVEAYVDFERLSTMLEMPQR